MEADRQPATIFIMRGQNVRYSEIFTESGRTGHDPVADIQPSRAHHQKLTSGLLEPRCNWTGGRPSRSPSFDAYGQRPFAHIFTGSVAG